MREVRLVVLCALMTAFAGLSACGGGSNGDAIVTIAPESPKGLVEEATVDDVHSGRVEGAFLIDNRSKRELISMHLAGEFEGLGEGGLPKFFIATSSQGLIGGRRVDFNGRLGLLPSQAVFVYGPIRGELPYKPDKATFEQFKSKVEEAQEEGGKGDVMACLRAAEGVELARLVRNFEGKGQREYSDGTTVFTVEGEVDVPRVIAVLVRLAKDPACGAQMKALGLPSVSELEVAGRKGQVKETAVKLDVARRGGILRELNASVDWENPRGENVEFRLESELSGVNEAVEVDLSAERERPLNVLLRMFGTNQEQALQAGGVELVIGFLEGLGGGLIGQLPPPRP